MNKFCRIAALGVAVLLSASMLFGCRDEKDIADKFAIINESCDRALSLESGEILIYDTVKLDKDVEGVAQNGTTETYIVFENAPEDPHFGLERTEILDARDTASKYELIKNDKAVIEFIDGVGKELAIDTEMPDIFEIFRINFDVSDIEDVTVTLLDKGIRAYALTMSDEYANKYDFNEEGISSDCTDVVICYYISSVKDFGNVTFEITSKLTADGETQTVTRFIDAKIA